MWDIGLARCHVKYCTLGMSPSDYNASLLPVFARWFRLFCHTNVVRIVTLCKKKIYILLLFSPHKLTRQLDKNSERKWNADDKTN